MDEVDGDGDAAAGGLRGDGLDLRVVPVHEGGPFPLAVRVAAVCLVKGGGDDGGMSPVTEAVSHFPFACGSRRFPFAFLSCAFFFLFFPGAVMMSSGARAFDAVGPLLLIGWAEVGPGLLRHIHSVRTLPDPARSGRPGD